MASEVRCTPSKPSSVILLSNANELTYSLNSEGGVENNRLRDPTLSRWTAGSPVLFPLMLCAPLLGASLRAAGNLSPFRAALFSKKHLPILALAAFSGRGQCNMAATGMRYGRVCSFKSRNDDTYPLSFERYAPPICEAGASSSSAARANISAVEAPDRERAEVVTIQQFELDADQRDRLLIRERA